MKILGFKAENILNLKCVEIIPQGDTVIITGKNGAGKTDVLNAIWYALAGTKDIPSEPVRKGEEKGYTEVDLGDYIATRKFTKGGTTSQLEVKTKEGAKFPSPQSLLDKLIGDTCFNPVDLMKAKNRDEMLLNIAGLSGKLEALDDERQEKYNKRRFENGEVKKLEAQINPNRKKVESINTEELREQERIARDLEKDIAFTAKEINIIKENLKKEEEDKERLEKSLEIMRQHSKEIGRSPEDIQEEVKKAEELNQKARDYEANEIIKAQYEGRKKEADNLTKEIEDIDKHKKELIQNAKFPVPGMGYRDSKVTFKDIPLDQLSKSEELLLGVQIQMALHPGLKVILVPDASLLDSENMKKLEELTGKEGYQIWVERVDDSGQVGVYIENGEIKGDNQ